MKNQQIKKIILFTILGIFFSYVYYNFYLVGEIEGITALKKTIDHKKQEIEVYKENQGVIDKKIQTVKNNSKESSLKIPDDFDKNEIIEIFYDFIAESGLEGDSITITNPKKSSGNYNMATASFSLKGDYKDIKDFIETLENDSRKYNIRQCSVNRGDINSVTLLVEMYSL